MEEQEKYLVPSIEIGIVPYRAECFYTTCASMYMHGSIFINLCGIYFP